MRYHNIVVDTVNLAYRTFKTKKELPQRLGQNEVYKESVKEFIRRMEQIEAEYMEEGGQIYFLIDNYYSRADMQNIFTYANRKELDEAYKATRKKENREFYNSINLCRYYYLHMPEYYHTARIEKLEADDLVKPLLETYCKDQTCLLITTDMDWTRYLSDKVHWLPDFGLPPQTTADMEAKLGFEITEESIIAYKALFGDVSDNIKGVSRETKEHKREFIELIKTVKFADDFITLSRTSDKYGILRDIQADESQYIINMYVISSIPIDNKHLQAVMTSGRDVEVMRKALREALGLDGAKKFKFGAVKRPRIEGEKEELPE